MTHAWAWIAHGPNKPEGRLGQYKLVRKVGQGGMRAVFEAIQEGLERRVAVKVLPPRFMGDASFVERFKREAKAAARLNHPNIVTIYEIGEHRNCPKKH
ncbi:MAG: hypothetical protein HY000_17770 [Planctomycetes bacterium]|nr:hypothetical protein [Planctomycetota bacterium]